MPFSYRIERDARLGAVVFHGDVKGHDLVGALGALFGDEAWEPGFAALWDGRPIRSIEVEFRYYAAVVSAATRLLDRIGGGTGVILARGVEVYARAALVQKYLGPVIGEQVRIAGDLPEALALLGVGQLPAGIRTLLAEHVTASEG